MRLAVEIGSPPMEPDAVLRRALWLTAVFNTAGALAFLWPGSLGQLAGLPAEAPLVYRASLAFLVGFFGATYAWLALQERIDRPLVGFAAFGKAGYFVVATACWLVGAVPPLAVVAASGDLGFAALFGWWLRTTRASAAAAR